MKVRAVIFSIFFSILILNLYSMEPSLIFKSLKYKNYITIPNNIDYNNFEVFCEIEYSYLGDWIGGCSRDNNSVVSRFYSIYGKLVYIGKNDEVLYVIDFPESIKLSGPVMEFTSESFAFKENYSYFTKMAVLTPTLLSLNELKGLIQIKKIYRIQIILDKVQVKWDYHCEPYSQNEEKSSEAKEFVEGKFEFKIGRQYTVNLNYESGPQGTKEKK